MINDKMFELGNSASIIRELFEYGKKRKKIIGNENVFDYSIGNPSNPAPEIVNETLTKLLKEKSSIELHGYTSAQGDYEVRTAIANYLNKTYGCAESGDLIYLTVGAAAALTISLHAILCTGDEVIVFAPYFPEYKVFIEQAGGKVVVVNCEIPSFQIDFCALRKAITKNTKAIIIDSPNNPTGVVLTNETITLLAKVLNEKEKEFHHPIYLISDEPYRELIYDDTKYPFVTNFYDNTIVCYSFSKSLSLAGERIGYILVGSKTVDAKRLYTAVCGAGRALGYVCAPAIFQYMLPACLGHTADLSVYQKNRDMLYQELTKIGYEVVYPNGAFYLFVKALEEDDLSFSKRAQAYELLLVPSKSFGFSGYVRISYCVNPKMIENSLKAFRALYDFYNKR